MDFNSGFLLAKGWCYKGIAQGVIVDYIGLNWLRDPKYCPSVTVDCSGLYCPKGGVIFLIIARVLLWTIVVSTVQGGCYDPKYCWESYC